MTFGFGGLKFIPAAPAGVSLFDPLRAAGGRDLLSGTKLDRLEIKKCGV